MRTALLFAVVLACGCAKSTELLLVVSSDLVLPTEADTLHLEISSTTSDGSILSQRYPLGSSIALPASLDLHGSRSAPPVTVLAQLERNGIPVVERRATVPFEADRALKLRIALDRSCLASVQMCDAKHTCADGVCIPVDVPPGDLEPIGKDPLAPADLGVATSSDLSVRPDLSSAQDLLATPDMACATVTPPAGPAGCILFDLSKGTTGLKFPTSVGVTVTQGCAGLDIHLDSGRHELRIFQNGETSTPFSANFKVVARYNAQSSADAWAGLDARVNMSYVSGETHELYSSAMGAAIVLRDDASSGSLPKTSPIPSTGQHLAELVRINTGTAEQKYVFTADSSYLTTPATQVPPGVVRSFVVANDNTNSTSDNAIDVRLYYLQFCPQ